MMLDFNQAPTQLQVINPADWEARVEALRSHLSGNATNLVRHIFPRARLQKNEARIGNVQGDSGESLSIALTGDQAGLWMDHATGESGDMIDMWRMSSGMGFKETVDDLEKFFGLASAPRFTSRAHKVGETRQADAIKNPQPVATKIEPPSHVWTYRAADETVIAYIKRYELTNGGKTFSPYLANGANRMPDPRPLYRLPEIRSAETVVFCEGEKCADALETIGLEATSAMGGAKTDLSKTDLTPLAGKTVVLWPDNDEPGTAYMEKVRPRLEEMGCIVKTLPIPQGVGPKWDAYDAIQEGRDVASMVMAAASDARPNIFRVLSISDLVNIKPPEWRIGGIFPVHGSSTIYGAYESFKTFVALDMLLSLASGQEWQGRPNKPCSVLYIAGEGQYGVAQRVSGWCGAKNDGAFPRGFLTLPESVAIPPGGDLDKLLRTIDSLPEMPGVIALDTITRMSGGGSLNDEKDMQQYVLGIDRLRAHTGAHIMNIGHSGKDKEKGLLGSVVLPAAMETIICVDRKGDGLTLINSNPKGKQKDGPNFDDITLKTERFEFIQAGEQSSTLILVPDVAPQAPIESGVERLGQRQKNVLLILGQATRERGPLGFTSLVTMSGLDSGSLGKTLRSLTEKGLIKETETGGTKRWELS